MSDNVKRRRYNTYRNSLCVIITAVIFIITSAVGYLFHCAGFQDTNVVVIYLLAVFITACLTHQFVYGLFASVLATFLFNYFFAEPYFNFGVNDPKYITTFVTMTVTAFITSILTSHAKQSEQTAQERQAETKAIFDITNRLSEAKTIEEIVETSVITINSCFNCRAVFHMCDETVRASSASQEREEYTLWSINGRECTLGTVGIPLKQAQAMNESQIRLLKAMIESIALSMDRFRAAEQRSKTRDEMERERYRSNLLRAISHDLRNPLSGIIGAAETVISISKPEDPRYTFMRDIYTEADWLHSLVENILNLTRLQDGKLVLKKRPEAVEEIIEGAVRRILKKTPNQKIAFTMPEDMLIVPMDAKLIEQVFINLLDNAVKHSEPEDEIMIIIEPDENHKTVGFIVRDSGTGIKESDLPQIFQAFFTSRTEHMDSGYGIGLGLAICEAIIMAHGGEIAARNRLGAQGAEFLFWLPMQ